MALCSDSFSFDKDLLAISAMASLMILVVAYIIYRIWGDEKIKIWVKQELWNLVMNGIVILVLMGFISWFQSSLTSADNIDSFMGLILLNHPYTLSDVGNGVSVGGSCLYEVSYNYSLTLISQSLAETAVNTWALAHLKYITGVSKTICAGSNFIVCLLGAPIVFISPYADLNWVTGLLSKVSSVMFTTVLLFGFSQGVLIKLFISSHFFDFLSLMIIMRMIPFTRTFANVIFALIFAFFIFYPLLIVLEAYILGVPFPSDGSIDSNVNVYQASALTSLDFAQPGDSTDLMTEDFEDIWKIKGTGSDLIIVKNDNLDVVNVSLIIADYSRFLFTAVLFGSINFIVVSLVLKEVLKFLGESNNLMEMFIRMTGIITW